jgi:hypothetical protein
MMLENTLQSTGYQPMGQYICLPTTQCNMPKPRIGQVEDINHFKTYRLYRYPSLKMAQIHNPSHVFTYIRLPGPLVEVQN